MKALQELILLVAASIQFSCRTPSQAVLPPVSGRTGEVLVVLDKAYWDNAVGGIIRQIFNTAYPQLPQSEPVFDIAHIPVSSFKDFLLHHRNVLIPEVSAGNPENPMIFERQRYADSQLIIRIRASDIPSMIRLLESKRDTIIALFNETERQRITASHRAHTDQSLMELVRSEQGISLIIPEGYHIASKDSFFIWLKQETGTVIMGIVVYDFPYTGRDDLSLSTLVARRNLKVRFIPGEVAGSYMTTEKEFLPEARNLLLHDNLPVTELRGLWRMENGISMGGPFISVSMIDTLRNRVVTTEGFVFAAGQQKRDYIRQVEAVVYSASW